MIVTKAKYDEMEFIKRVKLNFKGKYIYYTLSSKPPLCSALLAYFFPSVKLYVEMLTACFPRGSDERKPSFKKLPVLIGLKDLDSVQRI